MVSNLDHAGLVTNISGFNSDLYLLTISCIPGPNFISLNFIDGEKQDVTAKTINRKIRTLFILIKGLKFVITLKIYNRDFSI
jgi:hypothetical protein